MKIVTIEDVEFPRLYAEARSGEILGTYVKLGEIRQVVIGKNCIYVVLPADPNRLGVHITRSCHEAAALARRYLERESQRGNEVHWHSFRQTNRTDP